MIRPIIHCYRLALELYPRRVRGEYGREQLSVFTELLEDASRSGPVQVFTFSLREALEFPGNLLRAYNEEKMSNVKLTTSLRWSARVISILISAFLLLFIIGEGLPDILNGRAGELLPFLPLLGLALIGTILIWFRERTGAVLMIAGAVAMAVYIGEADMFLVYSLPYLLAGLLILAASFLNRPSRAGFN